MNLSVLIYVLMNNWETWTDRAQLFIDELTSDTSFEDLMPFLQDELVTDSLKWAALKAAEFVVEAVESNGMTPTPKLAHLLLTEEVVLDFFNKHSLGFKTSTLFSGYFTRNDISENDSEYVEICKALDATTTPYKNQLLGHLWSGTLEGQQLGGDTAWLYGVKGDLFDATQPLNQRLADLTRVEGLKNDLLALLPPEVTGFELSFFWAALDNLILPQIESMPSFSKREIARNARVTNDRQFQQSENNSDAPDINQRSFAYGINKRALTLFGRVTQCVDYVAFMVVLRTVYQIIKTQRNSVFSCIQVAGKHDYSVPEFYKAMPDYEEGLISSIRATESDFRNRAMIGANVWHFQEGYNEGFYYKSRSLVFRNMNRDRHDEDNPDFITVSPLSISTPHKRRDYCLEKFDRIVQQTIIALGYLEQDILSDNKRELK